MTKIITISRQFGSGGRTIGRRVADRLGVPCYDKELIAKIAEETGYAQDYVAEEAEYAPTKGKFAYSFLGRGFDGLSNADRIWFAQQRVILDLAEKEPCVIVGRCSDYVLRDHEDCLHAFVYASKEFRAERIVTKYGETTVDPMKRLAEKDKKRKSNYKYFTDREWGQMENFHLCIDSGHLGIEKSVELILNAIGGKHGE